MQSALPLGFQRGKLQRNDDNLGGGRLSRRAADPAVEAERRAQQDRHYALDPDRVERGQLFRLSLEASPQHDLAVCIVLLCSAS